MTDVRKIRLVEASDTKKADILKFLESINMNFELTDSEMDADISIDFPIAREIATDESLHCGGRIACPVALKVAEKLGITPGKFGEFMNLLDIKIYGCQLGCFK